MKRLLTYLLFATAMIVAGCSESFDDSKIWEELNSMQNQIDNLNGSAIPSIDNQIESIESSIEDLESVSATLKQQIAELEESDEATSEQVTILKAKDAELEQSISALRDYVNTLNQGTKDWAAATFATLEQYNSLATELANLKEMLENYNNEVATNLTNAISALETSMKSWVIEQLSGYYTIAQIDAKITTLEGSITEGDKALSEEIATLKSSLETLREEVTAAYKSAIEEAIAINNGVIDTKIATEIATINARIDSEIATLNSKITALQAQVDKNSADIAKLLARIQSVSYIPTYSDGKATMIYNELGSRATLDFEISPKSAVTELSELWSDVLSVKGVTTKTRAPQFINMPITEFSADTENGTISVTISGENLPQEYFNGTQIASVALAISDGNNSIISEYVPMVGQLQHNTIIYTADTKITPYDAAALGRDIISHVYDTTTGHGIITFDGDISQIGELAFLNCSQLSEIVLPHSITTIDGGAFRGCQSLKEIYIPESVAVINSGAFMDCTSLKSVTAHDKIKTFGQGVFSNCHALSTFYGSAASIDNRCLVLADELRAFAPAGVNNEYTIPDNILSIGRYAFQNATELKKIILGKSVSTIKYGAFSDCAALESVSFNENLTEIGDYAFQGCLALRSITTPIYVSSIGVSAFEGCQSLTSATIKSGSIGKRAFSNCEKLADVVIGNGVRLIDEYSFSGCRSLETINIPNSVEVIQKAAFYYCTSLKEVTLPKNIKDIANRLFRECTSLKSITIPEGVETISPLAFSLCSSLERISIPNGVKIIGYEAFNHCSSLTEVTIPESVISIGKLAFCNCPALAVVKCKPTTPPTGDNKMFNYADGSCVIYVPAESVDEYKAADGWYAYSASIVGYNF